MKLNIINTLLISSLLNFSLNAQVYYGDYNCDGKIDQKDLQTLASRITGSSAQSYYADMNQNGTVDIGDQILLAKTASNKIPQKEIVYSESSNPSSGYQWFPSVENQSVTDYITQVFYTSNSPTQMTKYCNYYNQINKKPLPYPNIKHQDWPEPVVLGEATYYNLVPGRDTTLLYVNGNQNIPVTIHPVGQLRMIRLEGTDNVRDLGGWKGLDGKRIRYGLIYRGAELNTAFSLSSLQEHGSTTTHTATAADIALLRKLNVKADLDMRSNANRVELPAPLNTSPIGSDIDYMQTEVSVADEAFTTNTAILENWAKSFRFILNHIRKGEAVYTHCVWGADRTGAICHLLEGLLGVSSSDIDKDFEITSFSNDLKARSGFSHSREAIEEISGATLQQKYYNWWNLKAGISTTELDEFIDIMLSSPQGTPQLPSINYDEFQLLENNSVHDYMTNVSYESVAYTKYSKCSQISAYANTGSNTPYPNVVRQDWPLGVTLGEATYYNLIPGQSYTLNYVENGTSTTVRVQTMGQLRMIRTEGTDNMRDLGGWETASGKKVRYGLLFRGSELNSNMTIQEIAAHKDVPVDKVSSHNATANDVKLFRDQLTIRADLDLRSDSETPEGTKTSPLGNDITYARYPISIADTCFTTGKYSLGLYASCFNFILNNLRSGKAVYIHGAWGSDRTGAICHMLEGLLGVSRSDIDKDFEISSFAYEGKPRSNSGYANARNAVDACSGSTIQKKYFNWWNTKVGIPEADLNELINLLLE